MDNKITSSILQACKLARDLETNLPNHSLASLSDSCDHIIRAFSDARDHLNSSISHAGGSSNVYSQAAMVGLFQAQPPPHQVFIRSCSMGTSDTAAAGDQSMQQQQQPIMMDVSSSADHPNVTVAGASSSSQRPRRRKVDDGDRRWIEVAAPEYGNTDIPPDDGFTWKKYGQKEILGCLFPRSYYRCTHQKLYNCPAKKQVQRLDSNPNTYQLTYRGQHTCHLSATAPAVANNTMPQWLLSHHYDPPVADMADAMFNSTTNSVTNTIDLIFSSHHDSQHINWEADIKKD